MATAHINIGSNIGDRHAHIELAVTRIMQIFDNVRRSEFIESDPWGYDSPNRYLNMGLAMEIGDTTPEELLTRLNEIERSISPTSHRNADGSYADRMIDIDLIAIDNIVINSTALTLPHPRMQLRPFVLRPLAELAPEWRHPINGLTAAEMLKSLQ